MTVKAKDVQLAELVELVKAGHEVLLAVDHKVVAKLIPFALESPSTKIAESKVE